MINSISQTTRNPAVTRRCFLKKDCEPNWITGSLGIYPTEMRKPQDAMDLSELESIRVQQDDLLKPMMDDIVRYGLNYAYEKYLNPTGNHDEYKYTMTSNPKTIIIVGAGMAGLSAAYELSKVGHNVKILEMQTRVGGRVKTLGEKDGFAKHCYANAGAMRLPDKSNSEVKMHFLSDYYAETEFGLKLLPFNNADENTWVKFYNKDKIRVSDWNKNADENFGTYWPGWDARIISTKAKEEYGIHDIVTYYMLTTNIAANQLKLKLRAAGGDNEKEADVWDKWILNWSKFSVIGFLQNTRDVVLQILDADHQLSDEESEKLNKLIPWPEEAIKAFSVFMSVGHFDRTLLYYLRVQLAQWWSKHMHQIDGGTAMLPEAFIKYRKLPNWKSRSIHLQEKVTFNVTVNEVEYEAEDHSNPQTQTVTVRGYYTNSGQPYSVDGDAVIITAPLHVIRHIKFVAKKNTTPSDQLDNFSRALDDICPLPATKVMIQCKNRFWEAEGIKGGSTITTLPIGQIIYPTCVDNAPSERGILMCYVWKYEAYSLASLKPQAAIHEAVRQIAEIHPEINETFEVGAVQAWSNEPFASGNCSWFKPQQYLSVREVVMYPCLNMFFAGDAISFVDGWMQGALMSGLRAAYQFYSRNENT